MGKNLFWRTWLVCLLWMFPCSLWAEEIKIATPKQLAGVQDKVAKTPEEFMQRVKKVWADPQSSTQTFIDIVTGIPLAMFTHGERPTEDGGLAYGFRPPYENNTLEIPYSVYSSNETGDSKTSRFDKITLLFHSRGLWPNHKTILCVNQDMVKEVLGEPKSIQFGRTLDSCSEYFVYSHDNQKIIFYFRCHREKAPSGFSVEIRNSICAHEVRFFVYKK
jgi:hypothetical protein